MNDEIHYNIFANNQRVGSIVKNQNEDQSFSAKVTLIVKTGEYKKVSPTGLNMPSFRANVKDFKEMTKDKLDTSIDEFLNIRFANFHIEMIENEL